MAFIVFEGLDGSGKSTLIKKFQQHLEKSGIDLVLTREPGGSPLAEEIRQLVLKKSSETTFPRTEILLYQASRAQHVESLIRPSLEKKKWVISDRFYGSTIAFQVFGRSLPRSEVDWLNDFAVNGVHPDLTVLVDVPVEVSQKRIHNRSQSESVELDRMESEKLDFHHRVRLGYLDQAQKSQQWLTLDGQQSSDDLFEQLLGCLRDKGFKL